MCFRKLSILLISKKHFYKYISSELTIVQTVYFLINKRERSTSEVNGGINPENAMMLYIFGYCELSELKFAKG